MDHPERIVIAGGSGFIGAALSRSLRAGGREVVVLSRRPPDRVDSPGWARWDARTHGPWANVLEGAAAVINLAGRSVDCVKSPGNRDEILRSRVEATRVLGEAVRSAACPPRAWVQMSTAHIYGDPPQAVCSEDSPSGDGFAPTVGRAWEDAFARVCPESVRAVVLRTGFVLGRDGGAMKRLHTLVRWGLGGTIGSGRQGISWIHLDDLTALIERAITNPTMRGVYVATAPDPVSNARFMRELRRVLGVPFGLPAPEWLVRFGARVVMRNDPELALYGRYCVSRRLAEEGFSFRYPTIERALSALYGEPEAGTRARSIGA